jgi:hypothetical protein
LNPSCFPLAIFLWIAKSHEANSPEREPKPQRQLTFNKDIAPILYHCSGCHRTKLRPSRCWGGRLKNMPRDIKVPAAALAPWLPGPGMANLLGRAG